MLTQPVVKPTMATYALTAIQSHVEQPGHAVRLWWFQTAAH